VFIAHIYIHLRRHKFFYPLLRISYELLTLRVHSFKTITMILYVITLILPTKSDVIRDKILCDSLVQ